MAPNAPRPDHLAVNWNPILLWLLIHGGDPGPEQEVADVTTALAIHQLAAGLENAGLRREIQAVAARAVHASAGALAQK
jgi:hypothetical protein